MHLSYLGPVSCVFTSWVSSGLTVGSGCSLMAARWQVFSSFLSSLRAHQLAGGGCNRWWLWHPLFTDMAGSIPFLDIFCCCWSLVSHIFSFPQLCLLWSCPSPGKDTTGRKEKAMAAGPLLLGVQVSSFFSLKPLPYSLFLYCRWASPQKTGPLRSLNVGCFPQNSPSASLS